MGKSIEELADEVKFGDLLVLKLAAHIEGCVHLKSAKGVDFGAGYFEKMDDRIIYLNPCQKMAYHECEHPVQFEIKDVISYEILQRLELTEDDEIDQTLAGVLDALKIG